MNDAPDKGTGAHGNVLIIGGSRGIGAACAGLFARTADRMILTYNRRFAHAERVIASLEGGAVVTSAPCDLSDDTSLHALVETARERMELIDVIVISAAGGMEPGKPLTYADEVNGLGPARLAALFLPLCRSGATILFLTSHEAHLYGQKEPFGPYASIARSKKLGEENVLAMRSAFEARGVSLRIVSADVVEGSTTAKLLEYRNPGLIESRRRILGRLPKTEDVAQAIHTLAMKPAEEFGEISYIWDIRGYLEDAD